ncbi:dysbindin domain-containing protein 2-like isoform X1 [Hyla sarda]|uniref:dysbindin domain-containing protein 2-like isoform X1 n=1 Tax=Hyla sarda TaxID=327740 RepID=UPI0024C23E97|nr:dysbindin domain-containing protein 2-like isoform X1 [Hyla sarda]XP_056420902.1 dysbindin domain-containing protein 2-like isoform X1 [Hyla sarda]XP_056420903.1 dysbindin domain-containing protein 2-like isoform X1 [Hyla sarda]XP_056420904.1 dysbindin domain-containing protein 2-like isoform X1 [Hyla sarda]XP_056420905.1 dysbindin domain-containing protein 2-like isoform X1 [Hyla sarda]
MTARSQGHPVFQSQSSSTQHLRDRQRFFEDVLAHDVDMYYPQIHLLNDRWRPPLDSVSSMEVNIDSMELSEPLDISELESSDTFQQSEDPLSPLVSPGNFQGIDYFRLRLPFSPSPGQQHPAHDSGDTIERQEEAADEQSKEHILSLDHEQSDHKTPLSEPQ